MTKPEELVADLTIEIFARIVRSKLEPKEIPSVLATVCTLAIQAVTTDEKEQESLIETMAKGVRIGMKAGQMDAKKQREFRGLVAHRIQEMHFEAMVGLSGGGII